MNFKTVDKFRYLDFLINHKNTGSPKELASKLKISERAVYDYISFLKSLEAPIKYSKTRKTYYYEIDGTFEIGFKRYSITRQLSPA